jgi:NTP pyrophosphatase (non-canonical NTP hydrolase)
MDFDEYQKLTRKTAIYPKDGLTPILYTSLGLASEAGEVAGKIKKIIRDGGNVFPDRDKCDEIRAELGDVLWYCARLADELEIDLSNVAMKNIEKLIDRLDRDVIKGEGDVR